MNTILFLTLIFIFKSIVHGAEVKSVCGNDWIPFKDEKCVRLFQSLETRHRAEGACNQQSSTLVTIKSAAEQSFLIEYVFNTSDGNNIWIGAERRLNSSTEFDWSDGTPVQRFTYWATGYPTDDVRRPCVHMKSPLSRNLSEMEWVDASCDNGHWFICEKLQTWPIEYMQQVLLSTRRELQYSVDSFTATIGDIKKLITDTRNTLTTQGTQVEALQANPVPIGFIYVQLPNQPEPHTTWTTVEWVEITSQYAGLFFRAEGGDSESFGIIQTENSPRLFSVNQENTGPFAAVASFPPNEDMTNAVGIGVAAASTRGLRFIVTAGEVRPRNQAMRIWRRI